MDITSVLTAALKDRTSLTPALEKLEEARHFHGFSDLKEARKSFYAFTTAATAVFEPLRTTNGIPDYQVWQCAMVDEAVEGAYKEGRWLQTEGRPGHNPFFGKAMLKCAEEIK